MPTLHGLALESMLPRGIIRSAVGVGLGTGSMGLGAALSSPRLVGHGAIKAGQIAGALRKATAPAEGFLSNSKIQPSRLANALYQFQPKEEQFGY